LRSENATPFRDTKGVKLRAQRDAALAAHDAAFASNVALAACGPHLAARHRDASIPGTTR
jgi:hypothetical protein